MKACRACGSAQVNSFFSLGNMPLANALLAHPQLDMEEPRYPLDLSFCQECYLIQLDQIVAPEKLFSEYLYFSSFSTDMVHHACAIANRLVIERNLTSDSLIVEIASNDGYLLQWYQKSDIPVLGIEPAQNIAKVAQDEKNIPTRVEFFGVDLAQKLNREGKQADIIHANNVMAHVPDINGFVQGIRLILKPEGMAVIEVPYAVDMIERGEFDTIYHEHVYYFSVTALDKLFKKHDLIIKQVERISIHGGSLRLFVTPITSAAQQEDSVLNLLDSEKQMRQQWQLDLKVKQLQVELVSKLRDLKKAGKTIAAYGASAKGSTLLNYFGIGREIIEYVVDRSIYKQGKYMPGVLIPILPPSALSERQPDYVLLLTWNFAAEILAQQSEYRTRGGRFIVPLPQLYEV